MQFADLICLIFICSLLTVKQMIWFEKLNGVNYNRRKKQYTEITEKLKKRTIKKIVISIPASALLYATTIVKFMMILLLIMQKSH